MSGVARIGPNDESPRGPEGSAPGAHRWGLAGVQLTPRWGLGDDPRNDPPACFTFICATCGNEEVADPMAAMQTVKAVMKQWVQEGRPVQPTEVVRLVCAACMQKLELLNG